MMAISIVKEMEAKPESCLRKIRDSCAYYKEHMPATVAKSFTK